MFPSLIAKRIAANSRIVLSGSKQIHISAISRNEALENSIKEKVLTDEANVIRKNSVIDDCPPHVEELVQAYLKLNVIEVLQFSKRLTAITGYVPSSNRPTVVAAAPAAAAPAAAAPAPAAPAAPAAPEKTHFDIKLVSFKPDAKIKVIKEVRGITNLGLKEAKELVEGAPCNLMTKVKKDEAEKIVEKLKAETGAEVELV